MNETFFKILEISQDLSEKDGIIFGSTAWRIQTYPDSEKEFGEPSGEVDVFFPLGNGIEKILQSPGYERISDEEIEEVKENLGYAGIEDSNQHLFKKDGIIVDVSTQPLSLESEKVNFYGYEIRMVTKKQLVRMYKSASEKTDIPEKKVNDYKRMFNLLLRLNLDM